MADIASGVSTGSSLGTALSPGIGTAVGALIGGAASYFGGQSQNASARQQAVQQMVFQNQMSNTAHQREVADLRAAGLNPILSATGGQGASTPSGASAPVADKITPAVNSALSAFKLGFEASESASRTAQNSAKTAAQPLENQLTTNLADKATADANSARNQAGVYLEQGMKLKQLNDAGIAFKEIKQLDLGNVQTEVENNILSYDLEGAKAAALKAKNMGQIDDSNFGKFLRWVEAISNAIGFGSHLGASRSFSTHQKK